MLWTPSPGMVVDEELVLPTSFIHTSPWLWIQREHIVTTSVRGWQMSGGTQVAFLPALLFCNNPICNSLSCARFVHRKGWQVRNGTWVGALPILLSCVHHQQMKRWATSGDLTPIKILFWYYLSFLKHTHVCMTHKLLPEDKEADYVCNKHPFIVHRCTCDVTWLYWPIKTGMYRHIL